MRVCSFQAQATLTGRSPCRMWPAAAPRVVCEWLKRSHQLVCTLEFGTNLSTVIS